MSIRNRVLKSDGRRSGFTLLELLVVMAVIAVLMAFVAPAVQKVREMARAMECKSHLHQIGQSLHNFESQFQVLPPGNDFENGFGHSWCTRILPMIDRADLYQGYDWKKPWNDLSGTTGLTNKGFTDATVHLFMCPSTPTRFQGAGDYGGNYGTTQTGLTAGFSLGEGWEAGALLAVNTNGPRSRLVATSLGEFQDGLSQVIIVYECAGRVTNAGHWGAGTNCLAIEYPINGNPDGETIMSYHTVGGHVLFADGHVAFFSNSTDLTLLGRLATRSGGEVVETSL